MTTINGADPVYLYLDLIVQAEQYVKENPYSDPKIRSMLPEKTGKKTTIVCQKGSKTKKIKGIKPRCPKHYRKS